MTAGRSIVNPAVAQSPAIAFADDVPEHDRGLIASLLSECDALSINGRAEVAALPGGANNRNYTATTATTRLVVRIANVDADRFAVDRASAAQAQRDAAAVGLAPNILLVQLPEGHTVSEFVAGETLREDSLRNPTVLRAIGVALRRLHATATSARVFSPFEDVRKWSRLARDDGTPSPPDLDRLLALCDRVEELVVGADLPPAFCHNDTVPQNFMYRADGSVQLVDWDYAGWGWASFELASFCATAQLDEPLRDVLLTEYSGEVTAVQLATLDLLACVAAMREVTWALMATPKLKGTTTLLDGWSYEKYLEDNLALARELAARPDLEAKLDLAGSERGRLW